MTNNNSIEYNLTNRLFDNCKKRFIIDINDNDDVQITSCIESDQNRNCLVQLDDGERPKELQYQVGQGKRNQFRFRNYTLSESENNLREAIASLFKEEMGTEFERRTGNFINHPTHFNQDSLNERLTRSSGKLTSESDSEINRPVPKKIRTQLSKDSEQPKTSKKTNKAATRRNTMKRGRSTDRASKEPVAKRRKTDNNQSSMAATSKQRKMAGRPAVRSRSKKRNLSNARRGRRTTRTQQPKRKVTPKKAANKQNSKNKIVEIIDLESSIESDVVECSSTQNSQREMSDEMLRTAVNQLADYLKLRRPDEPMDTSRPTDETTNQTSSNNQIADQIPTNQQQATQSPVQIVTGEKRSLDKKSPVEQIDQSTQFVKPQVADSDQDRSTNKLLIGYGELEKRLAKMKELNQTNDERARARFKIGKASLQLKPKQSDSIYHANENLVLIDNRLGEKHLITCMTIILIGELVHLVQPQSTPNYDQLPIGCLLIGNLLNSVQFTVLGHFAYKFMNIIFPNLFNSIRTSSRLLCYCILLFLSYGMLRKSITNWIINNQSSIKLFPTNVVLCSLMLICYSIVALCLSTDGNRMMRRRKINEDPNDQEDWEEKSSENTRNWFDSIITILTPYIVIAPIIGSHSCRLYTIPKPILLLSSMIYMFGLYKYVICRLERTNLKQRGKLLVYELKSNLHLISNSSSQIRFLTFFGVLLIITAYNLLILNLWSFLLELLTLIYLKMRSKYLDRYFAHINRPIYNKYKTNNPYIFIPYLH